MLSFFAFSLVHFPERVRDGWSIKTIKKRTKIQKRTSWSTWEQTTQIQLWEWNEKKIKMNSHLEQTKFLKQKKTENEKLK